MIELVEAHYDSDVAVALVAALNVEINERYADTDETDGPDDREYLAEVTADVVTRPFGSFLIAQIDGRAVGCGAVKPLAGSRSVGEIKRMYTVPDARRSGVGAAVLAGLETIACELGYIRLQLETGTMQPEAIAMYETRGWVRITPYGRYKDSPESVCFARDVLRR